MQIVPVILCGGSGTRLWPLSRKAYPKQFLRLTGPYSLLQQTLMRAAAMDGATAPMVIANDHHRFLVWEQAEEIQQPLEAIILEPEGKNTAPAVAYAAFHLLSHVQPPSAPDSSATDDTDGSDAAIFGNDAVLLILPADHVIQGNTAFEKAIKHGKTIAEQGHIVTFGIVPTGPETGYGYIEAFLNDSSAQHFSVRRFVEKPSKDKAESYLKQGNYFWNSGIFMCKATTYLEELKRFRPDIYEICHRAMQGLRKDLHFLRLPREIVHTCPADSIDYAVMEHTNKAVVIPFAETWSDVGSWNSLKDVSTCNEDGNLISGDVLTQGCKNCLVRSEDRLVAVMGMEDTIVVETSDAVLICHKDHGQAIKDVVSALKKQGRKEAVEHPVVYRPWGHFQTIESGDRFQVKRITVKSGGILSSQMHHHRAEHWIVVKGTALVTQDDKEFLLKEDESVYIPLGVKHRLQNPGKIPLELIEVQTGSYLGEDDIVRFEDIYGRNKE
ncbi:MAG: mannose-1-phosphate guanylyltransferase/mannose-6-phosphate isomerase [Dissulfuribacterales bacterium]